MVPVVNPKQRAEPLSQEERRKAILEAVIPLLLDHGSRVTTSQMAKAAGVAEGTIFSVFPDKSTVVHEALKMSLDPEPTLKRLAAIEEDADLEERVRQAVQLLEARYDEVHTLVSVVRSIDAPSKKKGAKPGRAAMEGNRRTIEGLAAMLSVRHQELSVEPRRAASVLNSLMFALHFPLTDPDDRVTAEEVVDIVLNGIRRTNNKRKDS